MPVYRKHRDDREHERNNECQQSRWRQIETPRRPGVRHDVSNRSVGVECSLPRKVPFRRSSPLWILYERLVPLVYPSARTIAHLMTIGRHALSKAETITIAALENGVHSWGRPRRSSRHFKPWFATKLMLNSRYGSREPARAWWRSPAVSEGARRCPSLAYIAVAAGRAMARADDFARDDAWGCPTPLVLLPPNSI
jgi:hypothetical protein